MLRSKVKFSNVAALLALVLAISGGAYAASKIDGSDIRNQSIQNQKLEKRTIKGGKLANNIVGRRVLKNGVLGKLTESYFHTTEPGNGIALGSGGELEFSGVQLGKGITPVTDSDFRFADNGTYRVTLSLSIAKVNIPGTLLFTLDDVPSHLLSGEPTVGAQLVLDGMIIAGRNQILSVVSNTGLDVQLSSGTEATLTIHKVGPAKDPIRPAANPSLLPEAPSGG